MARRALPEIRSVSYEQGGALVCVFIHGAGPNSTPRELLGGLQAKAAAGRKVLGKRQGNKAADVLSAIKAGASNPAEIAKKSGVDKTQVHAYLAYHKKRGNVSGNAAKGYHAKA